MGGRALALNVVAGVYSGAMPTHSESRQVPYDADLMFSVVADVERYPEFLPWVTGLKVLSREKNAGKEIVVAEMTVGFAALRERYTSRVVLDAVARSIDVTQVEGVFRELENRWRFTPNGAANKACRIDFYLRFEFRSRLLSMVASKAMSLAVSTMTHAFEQRAEGIARHETSPI